MTLHELTDAPSVETFKSTNANTLICFSATWCGPCKQSKPQLIELAASYEQDPTVDVTVGIVYEHTLGDAVSTDYSVKAFPTYVLFGSNGSVERGRVTGIDFDAIRKMVEDAGCKKVLGEGNTLGGGGGGGDSVEEARARRLARFGLAPESKPRAPSSSSSTTEPTPASPVVEADMDTTEPTPTPTTTTTTTTTTAESQDVEMTDAEDSPVPMIDPTEALSKEDITTLTTVMGFSTIRAQKGLINSTNGIEGAVEWLLDHQEDEDIDQPVAAIPKPAAVAQSYRCNECQKVMSNMGNLELHANKTGHSDFEESTEAITPLTPEEKAAKMIQIKKLLQTKRDERLEVEKTENVEREKQRRFIGKEMVKTKDQMDRDKRKREAYIRKREKDASKRERVRIRAEFEKDKLERMANQGRLTSKLGVDGYNPDAIQYDVEGADGEEGGEGSGDAAMAPAQPASKPKPSVAKLDDYITKVASYRAGGDGGKCLKILLAYVRNVVDHPTEVKYQSINVENKAYRTKVKPFIGAKSLLLAIGFAPNEKGDALVLTGNAEGDEVDMDVLGQVRVKLEAAYAKY